MTPYRVVFTETAEHDLIEISAWYAARHPTGEARFFEAFASARKTLARYPGAGRERSELRVGVRSWPVHPYVIFYRADDSAKIVAIERVLHGRMDIGDGDLER